MTAQISQIKDERMPEPYVIFASVPLNFLSVCDICLRAVEFPIRLGIERM